MTITTIKNQLCVFEGSNHIWDSKMIPYTSSGSELLACPQQKCKLFVYNVKNVTKTIYAQKGHCLEIGLYVGEIMLFLFPGLSDLLKYYLLYGGTNENIRTQLYILDSQEGCIGNLIYPIDHYVCIDSPEEK